MRPKLDFYFLDSSLSITYYFQNEVGMLTIFGDLTFIFTTFASEKKQ